MKSSASILIAGLVATIGVGAAQAMPAPDANSVLILGPTVSGGLASNEAVAAGNHGYTPVVVTAAEWGVMSAADFSTYRALVLGDPTCGSLPVVAAAEANRTVWSSTVDGNVIVNGTDPVYHSGQGGFTMTDSGVAFAADIAGKTGLYVSLSCYYHDTSPSTPVPLLDQFGAFSVTGVGCYNNVHIVAAHPALAGMTDSSLSGWGCSVHEAFDGFPASFLPLVIANGVAQGAISFPDGSSGPPYVLARGEDVVPVECGNGLLQAPEECDDGNTDNGDGCAAQCTIEVVTESCDLDGDEDVDFDDVSAIFDARGSAASGPDDPRDVNGDGVITVNDGRFCALRCDEEACVALRPPLCGLLGIEPIGLLAWAAWRSRRKGRRSTR